MRYILVLLVVAAGLLMFTRPNAVFANGHSVTITGYNVSCKDSCNGAAKAVVTGGSGTFAFDWSGGPWDGEPSDSIYNLCPGNYSVIVTDLIDGGAAFDDVNITEPAQIRVLISPPAPTTDCFDTCDGSATAFAIFGNGGPWTYQWSPAPFETTQTATALCAGANTVTAWDLIGCTGDTTISVAEPPPLLANVTGVDPDCNVSCNGTAQSVPSGGTPPYTHLWNTGSTGTALTALCAGTYSDTVTDDKGCINIGTVVLIDPSALVLTMSKIDETCGGDCDGETTASVTGGTTPYTYIWDDALPQTDSAATGLCANTYCVTVTDANGCQEFGCIDVFSPPILTTGADSTDVLCFGDSTGTATATPAGGTGAYTYIWDDYMGQTTITATGLPAGPYCVTVTDVNGCTDTACTVVNEPPILTLAMDSVPASCNTICDGKAIALAGGGKPPYTYIWDDPGPQTSDTASGLCAAVYCVTVTDANGCQITDCIEVTQPLVLSTTMFQIDESCFGTCNGLAWTVPVGGTPPYTYVWDQGVPGTTDTTFSLCVGPANVTVTDANDCQTTGGVVITTIPAMVLAMDSVNILCGGTCTGQAIVSVTSGGTGPFTYLWDDSGGQTTATATGLCAGAYCVLVTDSNGCTETGCLTIGEPPPLALTVDSTNVTCFGFDDATVTANVSGGTTPYTYAWSSGCITSSCTGLPPSPPPYCVTVTDAGGCTITDCVNPDEPPILTLFTGSSDVNCNGDCDGTGTAFAGGGTPPYTYLWDDPAAQTNFLATGLCPGTWNVTVTDANGCFLVDNVVITEPSPIVANPSTTDATCGVCDGEVCVAPTGGTGPYAINWYTIPSPLSCVPGLCANSYPVEITDFNGCKDTVVVILNNTPVMTLTMDSVPVSCNGVCDGQAIVSVVGGTLPYTYLWDDPFNQTTDTAFNLCARPYSVQVTDGGGCVQFGSVTVTEPTPLLANITVVDVLCAGDCNGSVCTAPSGGIGPYTFLWSDGSTGTCMTALCPGTYFVTITDANGCDTVDSGVVNDQLLLTLTISTSTMVACNSDSTGSLTVTPSGGTAPYTYLWNDVGAQTDSTATGLDSGIYCVTVIDANGCTDNICDTITEPAAIVLDSAQTNVTCFGLSDGTAIALPAGGVTPYTFQWDDPSFQTTDTATGLPIGTYCVLLIDSNGCRDSSCVTITEPALLTSTIAGFDLNCNTVCTGIGIVTPSGGTEPYTYVWDDPDVQTDSIATGLCAGTFNVTITDTNGCTATNFIVITQPPLLVLDTAAVDILCNGDATGQAIAIIVGGTPPYTIIWDDPGSQTNATATGLFAGTYCVTVTDTNLCMDSACVTLTEPPAVDPGFSTIDATCGVCDGQASSTPSGGNPVPAYTYFWYDASPTSTTNTITAQCADVYNLEITDGNACIDTFTVGINNFGAPVLDSIDSTNASCFDSCDGTATVYVSGGTPPYTYLWDDPATQTDSIATGLCAGTYFCIIEDAASCTLVVSVTIAEPPEIISNIIGTNINCFGDCNGTASVSPTGGVPPYTYLWDDLGTSTDSSLTGLCADTFRVTITDFTGCSIIDSVIITEPLGGLVSIISDSTNISCFDLCDGSATDSVSGGTPPYTYVWDGFPFQADSVITGLLCVGITKVVVTDANGCKDSVNVDIFEPPVLTSSITATSNISCNGLCDGSATVTPVGGTPQYTYNWFSSGSQTDSVATALCANTTDSVEITDDNGCRDTMTVSLTQPDSLITSITDSTSVSCNLVCDGSLTGTPVGGTEPYTYNWNNGSTQTDSVATNLCGAQQDSLIVIDDKGCIDTLTATLAEPIVLSAGITDSTNISCNGLCDGTATVTPAGGTPGYVYNWISVGAQTDSVATGLCAGTIDTVVVTDSMLCTDTAYVTLSQPDSLAAIIDSTHNISCNGTCDGVIYSGVSGGTAPYTYIWTNGDTLDSSFALCAVIPYNVTITDSNGCQDSVVGTILTEPPAIIVIITDSTNATCNSANGPCDGTATVSVSGGFPPYTYLWTNAGNSTDTMATGLCANQIDTVFVTDSIGCTDTTALTLDEPPPIIITFTDSAYVNCNGVCDGMVTINVTGGTPAYTYLWNSVPAQTDTIAIGLCAGQAVVIVTDTLGCIATDSLNIIQPDSIIMSIDLQTSASCDSICDAMAVVSATGGTPPYTYLWSSGAVIDSAFNLCASTYSITITDANGCTHVDSVIITGPAGLTSSITSITMISCFGLCDGAATVTAGGGVPPYTYSWVDTSLGSIGGNFDTITNLCSDSDYYAVVRDANNCLTSVPFIITEPLPLTVNICDIVNVACNLSCDGSATVCPSGGTPPFTYLWNDSSNQTDSIATGLCAGTYKVEVTDSNGCIAVDSLVVITQPDPLTCEFYDTVQTGCGADSANGKVWVTGVGGTAPYSYAWNTTVFPPDTLDSAINLLAGNYNVTVTDTNDCESVCGVSITDTSDMAASITDSTMVSCFGLCDGEAIVTPTGSTTPYTYDWVDGTGVPILDFDSTGNSLCTGLYRAIVESNAGCLRSIPIFITEPPLLVVSIIDSTDVLCNSDSNGTATAAATGGTPPYTFVWTDSLGATVNTDTLADSLAAGTYCVLVTDLNGCQDSLCVTITEPITLTVTDSITAPICSNTCDGTAIVTPAGGTTPYTYSWTHDSTVVDSTAPNLCVDTIVVTVTDTNGCSVMDTIVITPLILSNAAAGPDTTICQGDTITLSAGPAGSFTWYQNSLSNSIGTGQTISFVPNDTGAINYILVVGDSICSDTDTVVVYVIPVSVDAGPDLQLPEGLCTTLSPTVINGSVYNWTPITGLNDPNIENPESCPEESITYYLTATNASGCVGTDSVRIDLVPEIPDGITPNGDGYNDVWELFILTLYPNNEVQVYNRWGEMVFNSPEGDKYVTKFDGTYKGKDLPVGTYYYIIKFNDGIKETLTGPITIMR